MKCLFYLNPLLRARYFPLSLYCGLGGLGGLSGRYRKYFSPQCPLSPLSPQKKA